ncbi:MAG: hypothetical protein KDA89_08745, partial [Planctomycetaceae bacterium]|nr:hypothetical protein [Planctomycetaceae bacterium]
MPSRKNRSFGRSAVPVEVLEHRAQPALVGIDMGGGAAVANWTSVSGTSDVQITGLPDETGAATQIDVDINFDSTLQGGNENFVPPAAELPSHSQALTGLDGAFTDSGNVEFTFSGLVPGAAYEIYVFAGDVFVSNQRVTIHGGGASDVVFNQPHNANQLIVNRDVGDSNRALGSYAEFMTADSNGEILVRIDNSPVSFPLSEFLGVAGVAIQQAGPPEVRIDNAAALENSGTMSFAVRLTSPAVGPVTLTLTTADSSATAGSDYQATTGQVTIPDGATAATTTFDVPLLDDTQLEGPETFTVSVQSVDVGAVNDFSDTGTGTILDDDARLLLTFDRSSISEAAGAAAAQGTVTRTTDTTNALTVTLTSSDTTEATVPASVVIPAGSATATFDIDAVDDTIVDADQTVIITASATNLTDGTQSIVVTNDDIAALTATIDVSSVTEDTGSGTATVTITRNTSTTAALTVDLTSSLPSTVLVPATIDIPAGQTSITFQVGIADDDIAQGTRTAVITATATGLLDGSVTIDVTDDDVPTLTLTSSTSAVSEAAGNNAATITVRRNTPTDIPLNVTLSSSDTSSLTVPSFVTIPIGQTSVTVSVSTIDNQLVDGNRTVTVRAISGGLIDGVVTLDVADNDVATLQLSVTPATFGEADGTAVATATVSRNTPTTAALTVQLFSGDTTEVTVPSTLTIPAGQMSATFTLNAVNDAIVDGTQTVTIRAQSSGFTAGTQTVDVTDDDVPVLTLTTADASIDEDGGAAATRATLTRNTNPAAALDVGLAVNVLGEIVVPTVVTIPAGRSSVTFDIGAVADNLVDGDQSVDITAALAGYTSGVAALTVVDVDVESVFLTLDSSTVSEADGTVSGTVYRNTDPAGELVVAVSSSDTSEATVPTTVTIPDG